MAGTKQLGYAKEFGKAVLQQVNLDLEQVSRIEVIADASERLVRVNVYAYASREDILALIPDLDRSKVTINVTDIKETLG